MGYSAEYGVLSLGESSADLRPRKRFATEITRFLRGLCTESMRSPGAHYHAVIRFLAILFFVSSDHYWRLLYM